MQEILNANVKVYPKATREVIKALDRCSDSSLCLNIITILSKRNCGLFFMLFESVGWLRNAIQGIWSFAF